MGVLGTETEEGEVEDDGEGQLCGEMPLIDGADQEVRIVLQRLAGDGALTQEAQDDLLFVLALGA